MLNLNKLKIERVMSELKNMYSRNYGLMEPEFGNILAWSGNLALEIISNSDALYHNVDHTIMVTMVGQEIIRGKHLKEGGVAPNDWLNFVLALLCHDIGYVKGICKNDKIDTVCDGKGNSIKIDPNGTDAQLSEYHVDRGKTFIMERFAERPLIDAEAVSSFIEMTRFPCPDDEEHRPTSTLAGLTRAADFIGQLGDPNHLNKTAALYYEFVETGAAEKYGYNSPGDIRKKYAEFFWNNVEPYIRDAVKYLEVTQEGKQWVASLHSHVFDIEHYRK